MSAATTVVSGSSFATERQPRTGRILRLAALFSMVVTAPYSILLLVAIFMSAALTGQVFFPDLSTRDGLAYAGRHTMATQIGYLSDGLTHVLFMVTLVAVFAVLRTRWPVCAALLLVGATWQFVAGVTKALTSFYIAGSLGASYLAANASGKMALLPLGGVVEGLRQGLQDMDTHGMQAVWVLIALLPSETRIPAWVRRLGWILAAAFLIPFGFVGFLLYSVLVPVWAFLLGRWLMRQSSTAVATD